MILSDPQVLAALRSAENIVLTHARNTVGIVGYGVAVLSESGRVVNITSFRNLVTTAGDEYYTKKAIVGISPALPAAPTAVNGMKLGTGTTAVAKSGAGAALDTYLSGSNGSFDTSYPQASAVAGTNTGWQATYQTTWSPGVATHSAISEVVLVNDAASDATSTASNTYSRALLSPAANKAATQSLAILWNHVFLGA